MRPVPLDHESLVRLRDEYRAAGHGTKQAVLSNWAERYDCDPGTLRNLIYSNGRKPRMALDELPKEKIDLAIKVAGTFSKMPVASRRKIPSWKRIIRMAVETGKIPDGALKPREMSAIAKRYRLLPRYRVTRRFARTEPNSLHQLDFSRSLVLAPAGSGFAGDVLQVLSKHQVPYLNKPGEGIRVWIGLVKDDASGVVFARYYLARGEGSEQAITLMRDAWMRKGNYPFWGVPRNFYRDNASWGKTEKVNRLCDLLEIEDITTGEAGQAWKKGKVERAILDIKDELEDAIAMLGKGHQLSLADANAKLALHCMQINSRPHLQNPGKTRLEYWRENVRELWFPENYDDLAYKHHEVTSSRGRIRFKGIDYWTPPGVPDGKKIELVELRGIFYLYLPKDAFGPARRIALTEAVFNQAPPVYEAAEEFKKAAALYESEIEPLSSERLDEILLGRLPADVDFSPPPPTKRVRLEGAGTELLSGDVQREVLRDAIGKPLGELDVFALETIDKFCSIPHSRDEIVRFASRLASGFYANEESRYAEES